MSTLISRDAFARKELHRKNVFVYGSTACAFCGRVRKTPSGKHYLYRYFVLRDDNSREYQDDHVFCSVGCRNSFYDC